MRRSRLGKSHKVIIALVDMAVLVLSYYLAFGLRYSGNIDSRNVEAVTRIMPYMAIFLISIFYVYEMYANRERDNQHLFVTIVLSVIMLAFFTSFGAFFFRSFAFPRSIILIASVIQVMLFCTWRYLLKRHLALISPKRKVLAVGQAKLISRLADAIEENRLESLQVVKKMDISTCSLEDIDREMNGIDEMLIVCGDENQWQERLSHYCIDRSIPFYILPSVYELMISEYRLELINDIPVFHIEQLRLTQEQRLFKRIFDLVLSALALMLFAPFMVLIALAIKMDSPGKVFYRQSRVTENNKEFRVFKFRTMIEDAEAHTGPVLATKDDPRITKVGAFLRRTRLDEIPQFINVFKGEMSVVGPRPEREHFIDFYAQENPQFRSRLNVKAGITGLAQVYGKYSTFMADKLKYDLLYIKKYSLLLDLTIVLKTLQVVFSAEQSEGITDYKE